MKKNLISIIILALLIVNIALTAVMMFSVLGTSKKTSALVGDIATVLQLETGTGAEAEEALSVSLQDTEVYDIADSMTIPLKVGEDGGSHFAMVNVALSINVKSEVYKTYGSDLSGQESLIKNEIIEVFGEYTMEEAQVNSDGIRNEILARLQNMFGATDYIYAVSFSNIVLQ